MNNKLTVGQLAKKANVSVRTIQYYDTIDLLKPSQVTESGRRLYDESDLAILHQIKTLKSFGLSLKDIKDRLQPVDNAMAIMNLLDQQSKIIKEQIAMQNKLLESIRMLQKDIETSSQVNWQRYAQILELIGDNNENYWVLKFIDDDILTRMTQLHAVDSELSISWLRDLLERVKNLMAKGNTPQSDAGQAIAHEWWTFVQKYSGGDPKLIQQLASFYGTAMDWPESLRALHEATNPFLEACIEAYMSTHNINLEWRNQ